MGVSLFAATSDSADDVSKVAADLGFPVAYGVTQEDGDRIGAWWEDRRGHIQPSEFILTGEGRVMSSTYSSSPVGRLDSAEALTLLGFLSSRPKK